MTPEQEECDAVAERMKHDLKYRNNAREVFTSGCVTEGIEDLNDADYRGAAETLQYMVAMGARAKDLIKEAS